jgi:uncharacterized FlaG/YvyC family protein
MRIINGVDGFFSVVAFDKGASSQNHPISSGHKLRETPKTAAFSVNETGNSRTDYDIRDQLERKGMEVSFLVDPSSGRAQMVIVESGTGREVLKVPSDSALYQAIENRNAGVSKSG